MCRKAASVGAVVLFTLLGLTTCPAQDARSSTPNNASPATSSELGATDKATEPNRSESRASGHDATDSGTAAPGTNAPASGDSAKGNGTAAGANGSSPTTAVSGPNGTESNSGGAAANPSGADTNQATSTSQTAQVRPKKFNCLSGRAGATTAQGAVTVGIVGALLGAMLGGKQGAAIGGAAGLALGGAVGCWTAHEQAVAAAEEDQLNEDIQALNDRGAQLHAYNTELALKAAQLRNEIAEALISNQNLRAQNIALANKDLVDAQAKAKDEMVGVEKAIARTNDQIAQLDKHAPDYKDRLAGYRHSLNELKSSRDTLNDILTMQPA